MISQAFCAGSQAIKEYETCQCTHEVVRVCRGHTFGLIHGHGQQHLCSLNFAQFFYLQMTNNDAVTHATLIAICKTWNLINLGCKIILGLIKHLSTRKISGIEHCPRYGSESLMWLRISEI